MYVKILNCVNPHGSTHFNRTVPVYNRRGFPTLGKKGGVVSYIFLYFYV